MITQLNSLHSDEPFWIAECLHKSVITLNSKLRQPNAFQKQTQNDFTSVGVLIANSVKEKLSFQPILQKALR